MATKMIVGEGMNEILNSELSLFSMMKISNVPSFVMHIRI